MIQKKSFSDAITANIGVVEGLLGVRFIKKSAYIRVGENIKLGKGLFSIDVETDGITGLIYCGYKVSGEVQIISGDKQVWGTTADSGRYRIYDDGYNYVFQNMAKVGQYITIHQWK